jgi:CRISPR-associated protein (TIGR03986 family)
MTAEPPPTFHNPYTFIPAPPRSGPAAAGQLGDAAPLGHARYHDEAWTGVLRVELEVVTPLALPDPARAAWDARTGHRGLPVRTRDGKPLIAPTAIKGMIRSAYETVTNSRLGVFTSGRERLAFRQDAHTGADAMPVMIRNGRVRFVETAWLPRYVKQRRGRTWVRDRGGEPRLTYIDDPAAVPRHGDRAYAELTIRPHGSGRFGFFQVTRIARRRSALPDGFVVRGAVWVSNDNIENKHDERFFFPLPAEEEEPELTDRLRQRWQRIRRWRDMKLEPGLIEAWDELMRSYAAEADRELAARRRTGQPADDRLDLPGGKSRDALSRHVITPPSLTDGSLTLAFAHVKESPGGVEITGLFPVHVSRQLHPKAPKEFLDPSLRPATSIERLSPADRVFGWVSEGREAANRRRPAHRGQVRIGPVVPRDDVRVASFAEGLPLPILSSPKPHQARFYLGVRDPRQGSAPQPPGPKGSAGYDKPEGKALRGRKAYWHHAGLPDSYWAAPEDPTPIAGRHREYVRPGRERDDQNVSLQGWVEPGGQFTFDVRVTNLTGVELGALLWLLTHEEHHHRLGAARPLGFGSVRLRLTGCELSTGAELRDGYARLGRPRRSGPEVASGLIDQFTGAAAAAYGRAFGQIPFIEAFEAVGRGRAEPVHYPRLAQRPDPRGENFKWFVASERNGGRSLPAATDRRGLPYEPDRGGRAGA